MNNQSKVEKPLIAHVELRPMKDVGDVWAMTYMGDADYYNVYCAAPGVPATLSRTFEDISEAIEYVTRDRSFAGVPRWYNGYEVMEEIASKEDFIFALCASEFHDDECMIEIGEKLGFAGPETEALIAVYRNRH